MTGLERDLIEIVEVRLYRVGKRWMTTVGLHGDPVPTTMQSTPAVATTIRHALDEAERLLETAAKEDPVQ